MEEKNAPVEQITAPVESTSLDGVPKGRSSLAKKDPKKVAAGKALARKNKEAREAKLKLDGIQQQVEGQSQPYSPFDTFRNASMLVGSALVLYHGYQAISGLRPLTKDVKNLRGGEGGGAPSEDVKNLRGGEGGGAPSENSIQME